MISQLRFTSFIHVFRSGLTICLTVVLSPLLATMAHASVESDLNEWLANRVTYTDCQDNWRLTADGLRQEFEGIIREGVARLDAINHDLVADRLARFKTQRLRVTCEIPHTHGANAEMQWGDILSRSTIRVGLILRDPQVALVRDRQVGLIISRSIVFHEFLHFMGFDNQRHLHNNRRYLRQRTEGGRMGYERDVVYMCATLAFPGAEQRWGDSYMPAFANMTCAGARIVGGVVVAP